MFHFTVASLLLSLIVSSVGFVLFYYGKKQQRVVHLGFGLVLMVYPYFVTNPLWMVLIAVVLLGLFFGALRLGW